MEITNQEMELRQRKILNRLKRADPFKAFRQSDRTGIDAFRNVAFQSIQKDSAKRQIAKLELRARAVVEQAGQNLRLVSAKELPTVIRMLQPESDLDLHPGVAPSLVFKRFGQGGTRRRSGAELNTLLHAVASSLTELRVKALWIPPPMPGASKAASAALFI